MAGKFPSIPTFHAIEAYGFLAGFSIAPRWVFTKVPLTGFHRFAAVFSLGLSNGLRWVFAMDSAGFSAVFLEACSSMWIRRKIPIGRTSLENTM